jgi:hypothetical protein
MSKEENRRFWKIVGKTELVLTVPLALYWLIRYLIVGFLPAASMQSVVDQGHLLGDGTWLLALAPKGTLNRAWDILIPIVWVLIISLLIKQVLGIYVKLKEGFSLSTALILAMAFGLFFGAFIGLFEGLIAAIGNSIIFSAVFECIIVLIVIVVLLYQWITKE